MVLSPAGKITRYLYGITYLPFDVKMAIIEAQKGIARPTSNRILEYCFAYNPASQDIYSAGHKDSRNNNYILAAGDSGISACQKKEKINKS